MSMNGRFTGAEGPVGAGLDSIVIQDGRLVSYAADVSIDEDFELEGIRTLGYHGDRFFKSMGYTGSMQVGTFVLRGQDVPGALRTPGWQSDNTFTLNTAGEADFVMADVDTLTVLVTAVGAKLGTQGIQFPGRGLNTKSSSWRFIRCLPGLSTS